MTKTNSQSTNLPVTNQLLLLRATAAAASGYRLLDTFAGARVGARALAARRQAAAMAQTAIRADFRQALDVQRHLAAQIAFDDVLLLNQFTQHIDFGFGQIFDARVGTD